jgi:hypothetical protein
MRSVFYSFWLFTLLAFYVGSYYALVDRSGFMDVESGRDGPTLIRRPIYQIDGNIAIAIFAPWHEVDRWIRPEFWTTKGRGLGRVKSFRSFAVEISRDSRCSNGASREFVEVS